MKRFLSFLCFCLSLQMMAQFSGTIQGQVRDTNGNIMPGIAVYFLGNASEVSQPDHFDIKRYVYADAQGNYSFSYNSTQASSDSVQLSVSIYPVWDNQTLVDPIYVTAQNPNRTNVDLVTHHYSDECDPIMWLSWLPNRMVVNAVIPFDPYLNYSNPSFLWADNSTVQRSNFIRDHQMAFVQAGIPDTFSFSFAQLANGASIWTLQPYCHPHGRNRQYTHSWPHRCQAHYSVDSLASGNGNVYIRENSSKDSAASIVSYHWDFGDGQTSQLRYPSHTYANSGTYTLCLTITSVYGPDTCISTHCDTVGMDANGNLIYKSNASGFTLNVVDPNQSLGLHQPDLAKQVQLYPNPSQGKSRLDWNEELGVRNIGIFTLDGRPLQRISVQGTSAELVVDEPGLYLIVLETDRGVVVLKQLVH